MEAVQTANPPSFESVWAALQELTASQKETDRLAKDVFASQKELAASQKELAASQKELAASQKETDRLAKDVFASQKETDRQMKETDRVLKENAIDYNRRIGHLDNLFGEVAEYMIAPKLRDKFLEFGLNFPRANRNVSVNDRINKIYLEIDIILENGDKAMLIEVKTKLTEQRINSHIERLEKMRKHADLHGDSRTFLGAAAGVVVTEEVRNYVLNQGLYLIEPTGENFNITPPIGEPKEW